MGIILQNIVRSHNGENMSKFLVMSIYIWQGIPTGIRVIQEMSIVKIQVEKKWSSNLGSGSKKGKKNASASKRHYGK